VSVEWSSDAELTIRFEDANGNEVMETSDDDGFRDEEFWTEPGWYEMTISQWSDERTEYHVHVNCPQESSC
jgi:hypothetical protein